MSLSDPHYLYQREQVWGVEKGQEQEFWMVLNQYFPLLCI